jgi:hypothetical protein
MRIVSSKSFLEAFAMAHLREVLREGTLFHEALGRCLNNWQKVEEQLFRISWSVGLHETFGWASTFYTHIRAFEQKVSLIDKLAELALENTPELVVWADIEQRLISLGKKRDRLVHYAIEFANNKYRVEPPLYALRKRQFSKKAPRTDGEHYFDTKELNKIGESFDQLTLDLLEFHERLLPLTHKVKVDLQSGFWRQKGLLSSTENLEEALGRLQKLDQILE